MLDQAQHPGVTQVLGSVSEKFGEWTEPVVVSQHRINLFAAATSDEQWIHVDPKRARTSHFRSTIAQGFLTIGLTAALMKAHGEKYEPEHPGAMLIHCGGSYALKKSVREGSLIKAHGRITSAEPRGRYSVRMVYQYEMALGNGDVVAIGHMDLIAIFK